VLEGGCDEGMSSDRVYLVVNKCHISHTELFNDQTLCLSHSGQRFITFVILQGRSRSQCS